MRKVHENIKALTFILFASYRSKCGCLLKHRCTEYCMILLWLFTLIAIVFKDVLNADFMWEWDDQIFVINPYTQNGFTKENMMSIFSEYYRGQYAPINQLYYTSVYHYFGYDPMIFHLGSLIFHWLNSFLVFLFSKKILSINNREETSLILAIVISSLFSVLPINVEPVVWVSASKVLISSFFFISSLLFYVKYLRKGKQPYYYLTLLCFFLSFLGKEQAVMLAPTLILMDCIYGKNFTSFHSVLEKFPFFILAILFGFITIDSQELDSAGTFYPMMERIPLASFTIFEYFVKTVLPINLSYLYPFPYLLEEPMPYYLLLYPIFFILIFIIIITADKTLTSFGLIFFFIQIVLVSNITSLARNSLIADRYAYLASIGILIFLVILWHKLLNQDNIKRIILFAYFLFIIFTSWNYSKKWESPSKLKEKLRTTIDSRDSH